MLRPALLGENHVSSGATAGGRRPIIDLANRSLVAGLAGYSAKRSIEGWCDKFRRIDFGTYEPVRDQLRILLRDVNRHRRTAGLELVPQQARRLRRTPLKPFGEALR